MKQKFITFTALTSLALTLGVFPVSGDVANCKPIYGGGKSCVQDESLKIDTLVKNPGDNSFTDNLETGGDKYAPGQEIVFRVEVTNTGTSSLEDVEITNTLPSYVVFKSGQGTFDKNNNTLKLTISELQENDKKSFDIKANIAEQSKLPTQTGLTCLTNRVTAVSDNRRSMDNAQFCVQSVTEEESESAQNNDTDSMTKGGQKVSPESGLPTIPDTTRKGKSVYPAPVTDEVPSTGPGTLALIALIPTALAGGALRHFSSIRSNRGKSRFRRNA